MFRPIFLQHEGCHHHHHGAECEHHHHHHHHCEEEVEAPDLSYEQVLALMSYMLEHNRSHANELAGIGAALEKEGRPEASQAIFEAVHFFEHCNDKIEEAIRLTEVG